MQFREDEDQQETTVARDALSGRSMESDERERHAAGQRVPAFRELMFWTVVIGLLGGLVAVAYYACLEFGMHLVWDRLPPLVERVLPASIQRHHWLWAITGVGGALVGLSLRLLGRPGEISAVVNNIHVEGGRIDVRQTPSMFVASLVSITAVGLLAAKALPPRAITTIRANTIFLSIFTPPFSFDLA